MQFNRITIFYPHAQNTYKMHNSPPPKGVKLSGKLKKVRKYFAIICKGNNFVLSIINKDKPYKPYKII